MALPTPVTPFLRWTANQALRSGAVNEIREDFRAEIYRVEDEAMERLDRMLERLDTMIGLMDRALTSIEAITALTTRSLGIEMMTAEQLRELAARLEDQSEAARRPAPAVHSGFGSGRRFK